MNLHLLYTYFDGFDQLVESIEKMIDHVDQVTVCFQTRSNKGNRRILNKRCEVIDEMIKLEKMFPSINFSKYNVDLQETTNENERRKHNQMIQKAKREGATHFILAACDHVYTKEHIEYAKIIMESYDYDLCITSMFTYYKTKEWRLDPLEDYFMPFIHKMHPNTEIFLKEYPVMVDPSVTVNTSRSLIVLDPQECILHHYSMIRKDMELKFRNSAASVNWSSEDLETFIREYNEAKLGDKISYFNGRKLVKV